MASERLLFMGMILALLGFLAYILWLRHIEKRREKRDG